MAIIKSGILGGGSGKVGAVTMTSWKGISIIKGRPESVANPRTTPQVNQRTKFSACVKWASLLLASLIIPLMNRFAVRQSGYNKFVGINTEFFDDLGVLDYPQMNFGTGKLGDTPITNVVADKSLNTIVITYPNSFQNQFQSLTDLAYYLIYNETQDIFIIRGAGGNVRSDGTKTFPIGANGQIGDVLHIYQVFLREDGTLVGNTAYFGATIIA